MAGRRNGTGGKKETEVKERKIKKKGRKAESKVDG